MDKQHPPARRNIRSSVEDADDGRPPRAEDRKKPLSPSRATRSVKRGAADSQPPASSHPPAATLYIVSTPIGNWEDISLRALRVLQQVALIVAEDPRVTRKLLDHFQIRTPLESLRATSLEAAPASLIARLQSGQSVAFVSDAGTPAIADPGQSLVAAALANGLAVVPVPGPTAALAALVVSGLPSGRFVFEGFPPRTQAGRQAFFRALASECRTLILYESRPYLRQTLQDLLVVLGPSRRIALARDLTRPFETIFHGTLAQAVDRFSPHPPHGEYTLILEGNCPTLPE